MLYLVPIFLLASAMADPALQQRYAQHVAVIGRFMNSGPQPRLVNVTESVSIATHEMYTPRYTVLHRCDNQTGCCGDKDPRFFQCGPDFSHVEQVKVWFHVRDFTTNTNELKAVEMQNHTQCECRTIANGIV